MVPFLWAGYIVLMWRPPVGRSITSDLIILVMWLVNLCPLLGFRVKTFYPMSDTSVDVFSGWLYCVATGKLKSVCVTDSMCDASGAFVNHCTGTAFGLDMGVAETVTRMTSGECLAETSVRESPGEGRAIDVAK